MFQGLFGTDASGGIKLQASGEEAHRSGFAAQADFVWLSRAIACSVCVAAAAARRSRGLARARRAPEHDLLEGEASLADGRDGRLEDGVVEQSAGSHLAQAKDGRDLDERLDVVGRVEEGEASREDGDENHAG